jgi:uncharacterized protein (DUF362 family)
LKTASKNTILISKVKAPSEIYPIIKKGLRSLGNLGLNSSSTVVIKPNLCCIKPQETGATTDPKVVEGIVTCLQNDYSAKSIYIVESDGSQVLADMAFKLLGYERLASRTGVELVNLSKSRFSDEDFPDNAFLRKVRYPDIMKKASFFISVPKIKTHGENSFTAALKNQFGCNPDPRKYRLHKRLDDAIVDLNVAFRPDLIVVDALIAMGGYRGPVDGVPIRMDTLIFGRDPVAIDHLAARIIGIDPNSVRYLVEARRRGVGSTDYTTIGEIPEHLDKRFLIDPPRLSNLYHLFRSES